MVAYSHYPVSADFFTNFVKKIFFRIHCRLVKKSLVEFTESYCMLQLLIIKLN